MAKRHTDFCGGSLLLLLLLLSTSHCGTGRGVAPVEATAPQEVNWVDAVVNGHGGVQAVEKLASFRALGEVTAHLRTGSGKLRRDFVAPGQLFIQIDYSQKSEVRILDGERGWRGDIQTQAPVSGLAHASMVYQMIRIAAPWFLLHHADRVSLAGGDAADAHGPRILRLAWSPLLTVEFWVEQGSQRIEKVRGVITAQGAVMAFSTHYSDYRNVEGTWLPFTEETYVGAQHTGTTLVEKFLFAPADPGPFAPTSGVALGTAN